MVRNSLDCAYVMCNNNRIANKELTFFTFPWKDATRYKEWMMNCGISHLYDVEPTVLRNRIVCEKHFRPGFILFSSKRKLLSRCAVPLESGCVVEVLPNQSDVKKVGVIDYNSGESLAVREVMGGLRTMKGASVNYKIQLEDNQVGGLQCQEESEDGPVRPDLVILPGCSHTSGTQELEQPYANLSQMTVDVKPELEPSMVKIEPGSDIEYASVGVSGHRTAVAFCRLCLKPANDEKTIVTLDVDKLRTPEHGKFAQMLKTLIPNFDFSLVHQPIMCHPCSTRLELAYQFVEETLESQKTIKAYQDQYVGNNEKVLCADVVKYKNRPDSGPPKKKKKKLTNKTTQPDGEFSCKTEIPFIEDGLGDASEDNLVTVEEMKIDHELLCAEFDSVESESFIKSEPGVDDFEVDPFSLISSNQSLGTVSGYSEPVSGTSQENCDESLVPLSHNNSAES